jgi:hypothetical protein
METENSLQCSKGPATESYPEPDESSPPLIPYFFKIDLIFVLHLRLILQTDLFR